MSKFSFENASQFESLFESKELQILNSIVQGIEQAMRSNKECADLFELEDENSEYTYMITLERTGWKTALDSCLKKYEQNEMWDATIDTYKLIEELNDKAS